MEALHSSTGHGLDDHGLPQGSPNTDSKSGSTSRKITWKQLLLNGEWYLPVGCKIV